MNWIKVHRRKVATGLCLGAAFLVLIFVAPSGVQVTVFAILFAVMLSEVMYQSLRHATTYKAAVLTTTLGIIIVLALIGTLAIIKQPHGALVLLAIALIVVATDTGAQVIGQLKGREGTFFPKLSPNKSLHGVLGGLFCGIIVAVFCTLMPVWGSKWPLLFALPFLAVAGDILESATKRSLGIKDFASYIPETGGLMDRADSWLPVLALIGFVL